MPKVYSRNCDHCGKPYIGKGKRFCSHGCFNVWLKISGIRKKSVALKCKQCLVEFVVPSHKSNRKYCSHLCYSKHIEKPRAKCYTHFQHYNNGRRKYSNLYTRAKRFGLVCMGYKEFIEWYSRQQRICHYCGIPQESWEQLKKPGFSNNSHKYNFSLDRKDPLIGYITSNIVIACDDCNRVKSNVLTYDEMLFIGKNFIRKKWIAQISKENEKCLC